MMKLAAKTPWHLWVLAILSLVWFAGGAHDYVRTKIENIEHFTKAAEFSGASLQVMLDYFGNYPLWASVAWAVGVWSAVAGSIMLLFRSRLAFHTYIASIVGLLFSTVPTFVSDLPGAMNTALTWGLLRTDLAVAVGHGVLFAAHD